ncbi:hypothetical protein KC959_01490 [Candidatus Saccharibacteria bacterium]|nr:hypothetical protein [Candidatus Saccharibacteria bacterium]
MRTQEIAENIAEGSAAHRHQVLSGLDEMYAALNMELSCLNLLAFDGQHTTISQAAARIDAWKQGAVDNEGLDDIGYAEQRKNAERLARFQLIARDSGSVGKDGFTYSVTDRGKVGLALAGHNLWLADKHDIPLALVYGAKIRRIKGEIDDATPVLSSPLFRALSLLVLREATKDGPIRLIDFPNMPLIEDVGLADDIKIGHVEELKSATAVQVVPVQEVKNGMPVLSKRVSMRNRSLVDDVCEIVSGIGRIDEGWVDFIQLGYQRAKEIICDPQTVSDLLTNREGFSQRTYEISQPKMRRALYELAANGPFSTGDFIRFLGGKHDRYYISKWLSDRVEEGLVDSRQLNGTNRREFYTPIKEELEVY